LASEDGNRGVSSEAEYPQQPVPPRCQAECRVLVGILGGPSLHAQSPRRSECCAELGRTVWRGVCISP